MNFDEEREPGWLLPEDLRRQAGNLAIDVAERLRDPDADERIVDRPDNIEPVFGSSMWSPGSMSHGLAGTSLMYSLLAASNPHYCELAHRHLQGAVQSISWNTRGGLMGGRRYPGRRPGSLRRGCSVPGFTGETDGLAHCRADEDGPRIFGLSEERRPLVRLRPDERRNGRAQNPD